MSLKDKIIELVSNKDYHLLDKEKIAKKLGITREWKKEFYKIIDEMKQEGIILEDTKHRLGTPEDMGLVLGKVQIGRKGFGFLVPDDKEKNPRDIFIATRYLNTAMNGDKALVKIKLEGTESRSPEGIVVEILERKNKYVVGTYQKSKNFGFVIPALKNVHNDVYISNKDALSAKNGQVVEVEITKWPENGKNPEGIITNILGYEGEKGIDVLTIIKSLGLPTEFPKEVEKEAEAISEDISFEEIKRREDLRKEIIFTIDGADAKDFDDAVSIKMLENGNFQLGVHIADVTNYVQYGTELDKEALSRSTSVYLVDRVVPMLPEKLSNGVCSLVPNKDRLTLSVIMEIDHKGKVQNHKIAESIINSTERLVYEDISDILEKDDEKQKEKYKHILDELYIMDQLCNILASKRKERGSIEFEFSETRIILNDQGKPIDIAKYDRRKANRVIEEFMLITNETVAEYMYWTELPFLYRVHEQPDEDKIMKFEKFIYNMGYQMKGSQEIHPKDLQEVLFKIKGTKEEHLINSVMLRSLKKAIYSETSGEHFGLAARYYTHFTSPIRRYPDLQIHRIIKLFINNSLSEKMIKRLKNSLPEIAKQTSNAERKADEAERETDDLKKAEYMLDKIGNIYEGAISGVTASGLYVALENTVEGFIHIRKLIDDHYIYDEDNYLLRGERTKKTYVIGDKINIEVEGVTLERREVDFNLVKEN